jgi:Ca-activated chloride channel family protein
MKNLVFADPLWLLALLLVPLVLWLRGRRAVPVLLVPFAAAWHRPSVVSPSRWRAFLISLALILLTIALARPQRVEDKREVRSQGYDIMLCIDLSGSMLAEDYEKNGERLNRLQAIKPVIQAFINNRPNDRIGVVVFGAQAYTLAPLTLDHDWLAGQVGRLKIGVVPPNATAIGDGLGIALTRLEQSAREANGRRAGAFVVLLTDGGNNSGALAPPQASEIAKSRGVPVYTIGAGVDGFAPMPVMNEKLEPVLDARGRKMYERRPADLDEGLLRDIAAQTGGQFYRAAETRTVESAFASIDKAQKIEFQAKSYLITTELFPWLAAPGLACIALAALGARRSGKTTEAAA